MVYNGWKDSQVDRCEITGIQSIHFWDGLNVKFQSMANPTATSWCQSINILTNYNYICIFWTASGNRMGVGKVVILVGDGEQNIGGTVQDFKNMVSSSM